jgi:putative membrane protein
MTLLGALIALSQRSLFPHHVADNNPLPGQTLEESASILADQQLGGAVMLVVGGVAYLAGGLALVAQVVPDSAQFPRTGRSL